MAKQHFQRIFEKNITRITPGVMFLRTPFSCTITGINIWIGGSNEFQSQIFNLRKNGVAQFSGSDRLIIPAGETSIEKTGLSISITKGDQLSIDLDALSITGVPAPISLQITVDDGLPDPLSTEQIQDMLATFLTAGTGQSISYNDGANSLTISNTGEILTTEQLQDAVAAFLENGTNITLTYDDSGNVLTIASSGGGGGSVPIEIGVAASDETTNLAAGTAKVIFRSPAGFTLTEARASLSTASSSGEVEINIKKNGTTIFGSEKLTIDQGEKTSTTAATPADLEITDFDDDDEIQIDLDGAGTGATGLKIWLIGTR